MKQIMSFLLQILSVLDIIPSPLAKKKKKLLDFSLNLRAKNVCIYDMILKRIRIVSSCKNHLELKTIYCMVVNSHIKQLDGNCNVYIYVPSRRFV